MSIECYKSECKYHNVATPFCDERECHFTQLSVNNKSGRKLPKTNTLTPMPAVKPAKASANNLPIVIQVIKLTTDGFPEIVLCNDNKMYRNYYTHTSAKWSEIYNFNMCLSYE